MRTKKSKKLRGDLRKTKRKVVAAKVAFSDVAGDAKQRFVEVEQNVAQYTKHNPLKAMSFSMLAGVIIAQFLHFHK
jgi:hypothetical protein